MKPQTKPATTAGVMPSLAELQKLTPVQAACNFVEQTRSAIRAFIVAAKLLLVIEPTLKPGQSLGSVIIKLANVGNGERRRVKSTIDNGRYAVRVWKELVEGGHIKEETFDTFTFGDMVSINRAMSGKSRQPLKAADVALVIESAPQNWHEELDCLFNYGQSLDDRASAEKKAEAKKDETTTTEAQPGDAQSEAATSPDAPASSPSGSEETASPVPDGKIVQMPTTPKATTKPVAEDAFKLIAALESLIGDMPRSEVVKVAPAIAELNTTVQTFLKPAKKSQKAKATPKPAKAA